MQLRKYAALAALLVLHTYGRAQVVGGQYAFEYLRLSNSPHVTALGGLNVSNPDNDISFALQNPALMRPGMHNELALDYNSYYGGIGVMNLQYGYNVEKIKTAFAFGVQYLNYGTFTQTDNIGNIYGDFKANDYAISLGASRQYLDHWRYGATIKYASSTLYDKSATAAVADVGINYYDTSSLIDFGVTAKNMGVMIKKYNNDVPTEPLPFDLQLGLSKQFKHLPLRLFVTAHHLYEWDIRYDDPNAINETTIITNDTSTKKTSAHFGDKLFRHFIFGAELSIAKRLVLTASYNDLHRSELAISGKTGIAGFAFGAGLYLNKFQVHYARSYYSLVGAYNEISITMALNKLFGIGTLGEHIHWSEVYPDWD
jgi:hypothetical protein